MTTATGAVTAAPARERRLPPTVAVVAFALIGPYVAPHGQADFVGPPFSGAIPGAPLGTDFLGHDVLSEVFYGNRPVTAEQRSWADGVLDEVADRPRAPAAEATSSSTSS